MVEPAAKAHIVLADAGTGVLLMLQDMLAAPLLLEVEAVLTILIRLPPEPKREVSSSTHY